MKEEIRSFYAELQGYLSQIPDSVGTSDWTQDSVLWNQLNFVIDELNRITSKNYSRFKIVPDSRSTNQYSKPYLTMRYSSYKANLGGLIARLHIEFFQNEEPPFKTMPSTVINQSQTQTQTQSMTTILEIHEKIISELSKHEVGTKERTFLEKIKDLLPGIKSGIDIISTIIKVGSDLGLSSADIHKLLHL